MIKKLDSLILRAFIGPFFATFLISLFVLILQFFWLYIDDLVGKNIDFFTIMRLVSYVAASTVPLALPLSLLLSSIMTYGNLGESFELVAIKSSGIPLLRFMQPLFITSLFIGYIAFLFQNNIIPVANLKLNALKYDIIVAKPAFDIKEGVFYDKIEGYVIKIGQKERDSIIKNVVIYEKIMGLQDNMLLAESGVMRVTPDKRFMEFELHNGWRYEEKGSPYGNNTQYVRLGFHDYKKVFDLSSFQMSKTQDSLFKYDPKMLTVVQLNYSIDSLKKYAHSLDKNVSNNFSLQFSFAKYEDSNWKKQALNASHNFKSSQTIIPDSLKNTLYDRAIQKINNVKSQSDFIKTNATANAVTLNQHLMEWHKKFTLSAACVVLFVIGAPLGSIIRKGGLGTPLIFAIIFFVLFYLLNTFGDKFAKQFVMTPFTGEWLSTFVLVPVGIFLTSKAMRDSQLFNKEYYFRFLKSVKKITAKIKGAKPRHN